MVDELRRVTRIRAAERNGCRRHGSGSFTGEVRSRVLVVDLVRSSGRGHVLRALPARVVGVAISDLSVQNVGLRMGFDQIIRAPFDGRKGVGELVSGPEIRPEFDHAPCQHCDRVSHRKSEFHVVSGVVVSSHKIHLIKPIKYFFLGLEIYINVLYENCLYLKAYIMV